MASRISSVWGYVFSSSTHEKKTIKEVFLVGGSEWIIPHLDHEQEEAFSQIYEILDTTPYLKILYVKSDLERLAQKVERVPPESFLILIQKNPKLRECLIRLQEESLKFPTLLLSQSPWETTVTQFCEKMAQKKNLLEDFHPILAKVDQTHHEIIGAFIKKSEFRQLLEYFIF